MSLADVLSVKKLADSINFMRLFFLKNNEQHIMNRIENKKVGTDIVDCVMAIFLFELTRVFRSGCSVYSKD